MENEEKDERVSILTVRRIWVDLALTLFSTQVIVYAVFLTRYELAKGNALMETLQVLMAQFAAAMAVATGTTFILLQRVDFVMFLTQMYKEYAERKRKEAEAKSRAEGKAEERELWIEWNNRRLEAEAKEEEFNEPPPNETENQSE